MSARSTSARGWRDRRSAPATSIPTRAPSIAREWRAAGRHRRRHHLQHDQRRQAAPARRAMRRGRQRGDPARTLLDPDLVRYEKVSSWPTRCSATALPARKSFASPTVLLKSGSHRGRAPETGFRPPALSTTSSFCGCTTRPWASARERRKTHPCPQSPRWVAHDPLAVCNSRRHPPWRGRAPRKRAGAAARSNIGRLFPPHTDHETQCRDGSSKRRADWCTDAFHGPGLRHGGLPL